MDRYKLADAILHLDRAAGDNFWHLSKGKTKVAEPLFAAAVYPNKITTADVDPIAIAEGDDLTEVVHDVALQLGDPEALRKEHS